MRTADRLRLAQLRSSHDGALTRFFAQTEMIQEKMTLKERVSGLESFISFLANRLPSDDLTKAQILRMADKLMHGGTWDGEKVVLEERTPLEMAQARILELEAENDDLRANQCLNENGIKKEYFTGEPCCPLQDRISGLRDEISRLEDQIAMSGSDGSPEEF